MEMLGESGSEHDDVHEMAAFFARMQRKDRRKGGTVSRSITETHKLICYQHNGVAWLSRFFRHRPNEPIKLLINNPLMVFLCTVKYTVTKFCTNDPLNASISRKPCNKASNVRYIDPSPGVTAYLSEGPPPFLSITNTR
jgi:hypothetical protein